MLGFSAFQREATLHGMQGPSEKLPDVCQTTKLQINSKEFICIYLHLVCFKVLFGLWLSGSQKTGIILFLL